jgi:sensor domain CHASE-containing protein
MLMPAARQVQHHSRRSYQAEMETVRHNLTTEAATRLANDNALTTSIETEATTREQRVTTLTTNLPVQREQTRSAANVTLNTALASETSRATNAEGTLDHKI